MKERERMSLAAFFALTPVLLLLVVILRSYYGFAVSYSWKKTFWIGLLFTICIAAGKALGGMLADRFGVKMVTVVSLAGAAVTVLLSAESPILGCLSILLFNMTMPMTLFSLARVMPGAKGFSFGLLTFALFLGFLPTYLGAGSISGMGMAVVAVLSALLLLPGILVCRKKEALGVCLCLF